MVKRTRDLVAEPLTISDYLRRPLIHRGRWLIVGTDTATGQIRQFYLSTTREQYRPLPLRIGIYEAGAKRPTKILFRPFEPTVRDRILLSRLVGRLNEDGTDEASLRIFADDLKIAFSA